jgi:hypothetical protein
MPLLQNFEWRTPGEQVSRALPPAVFLAVDAARTGRGGAD